MSLNNQLSRASTSIALNIAEGSGRWHKADKRNFFWIARGSVFECVAVVDILEKKQILTTDEAAQHRDQLRSLGRMLSQLITTQYPES